MSREIKFRGKRVDNGEWVYGDLLQTKPKHGDERVIIPSGCFEVNGLKCVVMEMPIIEWDTLGQLTGLKDKNGVEIYEGDLVEFKSERFTNFGNTPTGKYSVHVDVIEWMGIECKGRGRGCWGLRLVNADSFNKHKLGSPVGAAVHMPIHLYGKVIGNIHDNPELIA